MEIIIDKAFLDNVYINFDNTNEVYIDFFNFLKSLKYYKLKINLCL